MPTEPFIEFTAGRYIEIIAVLVLSSYFPLITFSFLRFRLNRKKEELKMILQGVNLVGEEAIMKIENSVSKEFAPRDFIMPVVFVTIISGIAMFLSMLTWMLYGTAGEFKSILLAGEEFWMNSGEMTITHRSMAVFTFSILGSYIAGVQYIYRRFATIDLTPSNFFSIGIRMMAGAMVALLLSWLIPDHYVSGNFVLVIAFLTGIFPERGLTLLLEKVKIFPGGPKSEFKNLPLTTLEGISYLHNQRLEEIGIDNVQNLAQYNFFMLIIKTPFPIRTLVDWVAQAKLVIEFQMDFLKLQKAGIRSSLDLLDALEDEKGKLIAKRLNDISEVSEIPKLAMEINYENLKKDKSVALLRHFRENMEQFDVRGNT